MAIPRASSEGSSRLPHSVSLKVLRLSKSVLSTQHALPPQDLDESFRLAQNEHNAALADLPWPASSTRDPRDQFLLTSGVRLPTAFGAVHVGETFVCTLCVNNELPVADPSKLSTDVTEAEVEVGNVSLSAEMQTPSEGNASVKLDLEPWSDFEDMGTLIAPGQTMNRLVRFHISDEGTYVLSATVSYLETRTRKREDGEVESSSRSRSFRKLYQFPATQVMRVRIKTRLLPTFLEKDLGKGYAVEAQLEKLGEDSLVLDGVNFGAKSAFRVKSLNAWDNVNDNIGADSQSLDAGTDIPENRELRPKTKPLLKTGDILQAAFLVLHDDRSNVSPEIGKDGRVELGQVTVSWRSSMGERGSLSTGKLSTRAG